MSARVSATRPVTLVSITVLDPLPVGLGQRVGRRGKASIVEQQVDPVPRRRDFARLSTAGNVTHVDLEREECIAEFLLQAAQAVSAAARADRVPAAGHELARGRLAEAGRRAGYQYRFGHLVFSLRARSRACYEDIGRNAKLPCHFEKSGSCASRKRRRAASRPGSSTRCRELVSPDSGQVEKTAGPPLVAERCRKSGEGKGDRIVWIFPGLHDLDNAEAG